MTVVDVQEDGAGGVLLVGEVDVQGRGGAETDVWMARHDLGGTRLWAREFGSGGRDSARRIMIDCQRTDLVVAGETTGDLAGPGAHVGGIDTWVGQFDLETGGTIWTRQLGSSGDDTVAGVVSDGNGGLYVGGNTDGDLAGPPGGLGDAWVARIDKGLDFLRYCGLPVPNSTGLTGRMDARGDNRALANDLTLVAEQLPSHTFGIFVNSQTQGFTPWAGGSQGHLCVGGFIGRFVGPGQILGTGAGDSISLDVDLASFPTPTGSITVTAGETWHFQAWYRELDPVPTSNYTDALSITFR